MLVGQRPVGSRRLILFLEVLVALLALPAAWRWTPLQDGLSPQRVADFIGNPGSGHANFLEWNPATVRPPHREHADKQDVRIYDYVESDQPRLSRMWDKRQRGYRAMGYLIKPLDALILGRGANLK